MQTCLITVQDNAYHVNKFALYSKESLLWKKYWATFIVTRTFGVERDDRKIHEYEEVSFSKDYY